MTVHAAEPGMSIRRGMAHGSGQMAEHTAT